MDRDIDYVIAANVEAADGIVDREGEVDNRPARDRRIGFGNQDARRTPPLADLLVVGDGRLVVEDERTGEAVGVRQDSGDDDDRRAPPEPARRGDLSGRRAGRRRNLGVGWAAFRDRLLDERRSDPRSG